jgi:hypothetical protein
VVVKLLEKTWKSIGVVAMQTSPDETGDRVYAFEGFTLNATCRTLKADNCDLDLRPKSFDVLCCLLERAGVLFWTLVVVPVDFAVRSPTSSTQRAISDMPSCPTVG